MIKLFYLLSLSLLCLCGGCTTAEMGGCKNTVVTFKYTGDGTTDLFGDFIANVTYFIYDAAGVQVASGRMEPADLSLYRGFQLRLGEGEYEVVCWGNLEHYCQAVNTERKDEAQVLNIAHSSGKEPQTGDPLYYGKTTFRVDDTEGRATATVTFHSAHITIWAYTKGITDYDEKGVNRPPVFYVGGFESRYDFECNSGGNPLSFCPETVYKEEQMISMARCEVPRFNENTTSLLKVYKQSDYKLLEVVQLEKFIADNGIEISGKEEVTIPVLFDFHGLGVEVRMPSWEEGGVQPEW